MKGKVFLILILLLIPITSKALSCSYSEQARLRMIASNVNATYDYRELDNGEIKFDVTLTNFTNEIYLVDSYTGVTYYNNGTNEITLYDYNPGSKIKYTIYPVKINCTYSYLANKYVNLPYYNRYYKDELCLNKNYTICNKWQNVNLSYEDFKKRIEELEKVEEVTPIIENEKTSILDYVSNFIAKYYVFILIGIAITGVGIEYIVRKRNDFGF